MLFELTLFSAIFILGISVFAIDKERLRKPALVKTIGGTASVASWFELLALFI